MMKTSIAAAALLAVMALGACAQTQEASKVNTPAANVVSEKATAGQSE